MRTQSCKPPQTLFLLRNLTGNWTSRKLYFYIYMKALGVDTKAGSLERAISLHTVEKRTLEMYCT